MPATWLFIVLHQIVFQGMFVLKNIVLYRKIGQQIRGKNIEATLSIVFFVLFIGAALALALSRDFQEQTPGEILLLNEWTAMGSGLGLIVLNLLISIFSLLHLKDSWRVGVVAGQQTQLVSSGIYRFTRNPYFVSYILMFVAYTVLLQNVILLSLSLVGFIFVHKMILKEEKYLESVHGDVYLEYKTKTPRYLFV